MGAVLSVFALLFGGAGLAGLASVLVAHSVDRTGWFLGVASAVALLVGFWCGPTGWRLMTGRERRDGGLLSPLVMTVVGLACVTASIAGVVIRGPDWFGWLRLLPVALVCFGLARSRWHGMKSKSEAV